MSELSMFFAENAEKRENKFVVEYCSDDRIAIREYELV